MASLGLISGLFLYFVAVKVRGDSTYPHGVMILEAFTVDHPAAHLSDVGAPGLLRSFCTDRPWFQFQPGYMEAEGVFL